MSKEIVRRHAKIVELAGQLDLRPIVFHVTAGEAALVERVLRRHGGPRRRRGASLAAALRAGGAVRH